MSIFNTCDDCRSMAIEKAKSELVSSTNIEDSPDEMAVIDSILFRCWQMGWLDAKDKVIRMNDLMVEMYGFIRDVCELHPYVLTNAHIPEWQITDHSTPAERYAEKMRELGIEVDDV